MKKDKVREFELNKEEYKKQLPDRCANCNSATDLDVHHIVPLGKGGTNRLSNMATLCSMCTEGLGRVTVPIKSARERQIENMPEHNYSDDDRNLQKALMLFWDRERNKLSVQDIADITGISRATIYRKSKELPKIEVTEEE